MDIFLIQQPRLSNEALRSIQDAYKYSIMYETTLNLCLTSAVCYTAYQGLKASNWILGGI